MEAHARAAELLRVITLVTEWPRASSAGPQVTFPTVDARRPQWQHVGWPMGSRTMRSPPKSNVFGWSRFLSHLVFKDHAHARCVLRPGGGQNLIKDTQGLLCEYMAHERLKEDCHYVIFIRAALRTGGHPNELSHHARDAPCSGRHHCDRWLSCASGRRWRS